MDYTVTYGTNIYDGKLEITAYIYMTGYWEYSKAFSHTVSPPTWIQRKRNITMEHKIDSAKALLESNVASYIKRKNDERSLEKKVKKFLSSGKIEGATVVERYAPKEKSSIGFSLYGEPIPPTSLKPKEGPDE